MRKNVRKQAKPAPKAPVPIPVPNTGGMAQRIAQYEQRIDRASKANDCVGLVQVMNDLRESIGKVQTVKTALENLFSRVRFTALPNAMESSNLENFRVPGIGTCYLQDDIQLSEVQQATLHDWFVNHELEDMVTETVNHSTLAAYVRRLMASKDKKDQALLKELRTMMKIKPIVRAVITK